MWQREREIAGGAILIYQNCMLDVIEATNKINHIWPVASDE
jgi:hypothetical protein